MKLLLDTHVLLWQAGGIRRLGPEATDAIGNAEELWVSAVSYAEIGIKTSVGKLRAPRGLEDHLKGMGLRTLSLTAAHGLALRDLPLHHRDPFDRMLVVQAQLEGLSIVSADEALSRYDVRIIDAT